MRKKLDQDEISFKNLNEEGERNAHQSSLSELRYHLNVNKSSSIEKENSSLELNSLLKYIIMKRETIYVAYVEQG